MIIRPVTQIASTKLAICIKFLHEGDQVIIWVPKSMSYIHSGECYVQDGIFKQSLERAKKNTKIL